MKNLDCNIDSISFSFYTADEIRKLSTKEINSLVSIEPVLGKGAVNGLYDTLLGSLSDREPCRNCNLSYYDCNGHFGRIEFSKPIYNPMLMDILAKLIKGVCFYCHRFNYGHGFLESICDLSNIDDSSNMKRFHDLENFKSKSYSEKQKNAIQIISSQPRKNCEHCQNKSLVIKKSRKCEFIVHISSKTSHTDDEPDRKRIKLNDNQKLMKFKSSYTYEELYGRFTSTDNSLNPEILREHMRFLWFNEEENMKILLPLLNNNFEFPTDIFFMENMLINPPMNRLPAIMHGDNMTESPETTNMCNVIRAEAALREIIKRKDSSSSEQFYQNIREGILELQKRVNICFDSNKHKEIMGAQPGLRQKIDKKEGLFRSNIMGKRVNFACRSVISPDPTIGLDEIGVPIVFLIKLSFPEPLNYLNKDFLKQCVLNGPDMYPGAVSYQIDDRPAVVINKDREATVEFLELMLQKKNKVIINRHAISGDVLIMNRQPTLHRPSMQAHIIKAILDPKAKTIRMHYSNCKAYNADFDGDEMNGHYLQSILAQSEAKLLVNACHQHSTPKDGSPLAGLIQDHVIAGTRLCMRDVTLSRHECLDLVIYGLQNINTRPLKLPKPAILFPKRLWTGKQVLSTIIKYAIPEGLDLPNIVCEEPKKNAMWKISLREKELKLSDVDLIIINGYICCGIFDKVHIGPSQKGLCSDLRELYGSKIALDILTCISRVLNRYLIYSGFTTGIKDGFLNKTGETVRANILSKIKSVGLTSIAKAFNIPMKDLNLENTVNLMEVAQFNKSDEFRNKMSEIDTNFKSLSLKFVNQLGSTCKDNLRESFPYNNLSFMSQTGAKGGESNITKIAIGLGAIEIEGKRCPLTIGGRTLPSFKRYDFDPVSRGFCLSRFVSGLKPQELYFESMAGRDGLVDTAVKTSSSGYLQRCLIKHLEDITISYDGTVRDNMHNIIEFKYGYDGLDVVNSISLSKSDYMDVIGRNLQLMQKKYIKKKADPILSKSLLKKINVSIDKLKGDFVSISKDQEEVFRNIVSAKCVIAACAPGEAVGLLAAQSIGEPSTQMTLNTFHNAGQSEMNVTLGIPRLREILMLGSENINTPSMSVPIINSRENIAPEIKKFTKLFMKDVIELPFKISVDDYFEITFTFKNVKDYIGKTDLKRRELISLIEKTFFKSFSKALKKIFKQTSIQITDDKDDDVMSLNYQDEEKTIEKENDVSENVDLKDLSDLDDLDSDKEVDDDEEAINNDDDDDGDDNNDAKEGMELVDRVYIEQSKVKDMFRGVYRDYKIHHQEEPDWIKLSLDLSQSKFDVKSLLLNIFETTVLSSVEGVSKALIISKDNSFATEGYNHTELFKYDSIFDLNKFYSNNIVKMSKLYGIETAIRCIEKEVKTVFQSYSIEVNSRHLRLIADFLTYSGSVGAFSRHKMINHSSPVQRASYETTLSVLNEMMVYGTADYIKSPSSNIMFGQPVAYVGSNAMELCYNRDLI